MKYIKTEDGVYSEKLTKINDNKVYVRDLCCDYEEYTYAGEVISQADTPQELCDGFYLDLGGEFNDTYLRRKDRFEFLKELALEYMRKDIEVTLYGFIRTSKGLIYVAKMNEKGELELI